MPQLSDQALAMLHPLVDSSQTPQLSDMFLRYSNRRAFRSTDQFITFDSSKVLGSLLLAWLSHYLQA